MFHDRQLWGDISCLTCAWEHISIYPGKQWRASSICHGSFVISNLSYRLIVKVHFYVCWRTHAYLWRLLSSYSTPFSLSISSSCLSLILIDTCQPVLSNIVISQKSADELNLRRTPIKTKALKEVALSLKGLIWYWLNPNVWIPEPQ